MAVPLTEQMLLPTGEVRQVRSLEFCGLEIPLGPDPVGETRTETRERRLTAFGTPLPVVLIGAEHSLLEEQEVTRTEAEAEALAEQQLAELEQTQLGQAEVLERCSPVQWKGMFSCCGVIIWCWKMRHWSANLKSINKIVSG